MFVNCYAIPCNEHDDCRKISKSLSKLGFLFIYVIYRRFTNHYTHKKVCNAVGSSFGECENCWKAGRTTLRRDFCCSNKTGRHYIIILLKKYTIT